MTVEEFRKLGQEPVEMSLPLRALWQDAQGNWEAAHDLAQEEHSMEGSWVHAYLHRKEGDLGNARYWYARAGKPVFSGPLEEEWGELVAELL